MSLPTINSEGVKYWHLNGKLHRVNGPAAECPDGTKYWYINDELHRVDGPAIEKSDGTKMWYLNGERHRIDGPAIEGSDGKRYWFLNDKLHRVDGPAAEYPDGAKVWCINDKFHRVGGPAVERLDGMKRWFLDGEEFKQSEYFSLLEIRKFRSEITRFNKALGFGFINMLILSSGKTAVEWYYSPDNGGGKIAKKRIEYVISA